MTRFKIGDKVRIKKSAYDFFNNSDAKLVDSANVGTIIQTKMMNGSIPVEWVIAQDSFWDCDGLIPSKRGWYVEPEYLELVSKEKPPTTNLLLKILIDRNEEK